MVAIRFNLEAPDGGPDTAAPAAAEGNNPGGPLVDAADGEGVLPTPPQLPYAPGQGTYTQMWLSAAASTTVEDMKEEVESYIQVYTEAPIDYTTTQNTILSSTDGLCFLTILAGNQVCVIHSLGRFSSGLGRNTPANHRIFGLLGEKVGEQLPPTVMVPSAGLIPWLTPQNYHQPTDADLATLKDNADTTVDKPEIAGNENEDEDPNRPRVSVQNVCFIPKVWAPYFLAPLTPWKHIRRTRSSSPPSLGNSTRALIICMRGSP